MNYKQLFWEGVHQCLAHPLMFLSFRSKWSERFHHYTADKAWPVEEKQEEPKAESKEKERGTKIPNVVYGEYWLAHGSEAYDLHKEWKKKKGAAKTAAQKVLDDHIKAVVESGIQLAKRYAPKENKGVQS
jgi:hypothetical protein